MLSKIHGDDPDEIEFEAKGLSADMCLGEN